MKRSKKIIFIVAIILLMGLLAACSTDGRSFSVTFVSNGGSAVETLVTNKVEEAPAATRAGYALLGWYLDEDLRVPVSYPYLVTSATVFYASWERTYNIVYNIEGETSAQRVPYRVGEIVTAIETPTKAGYTFGGWDAEHPDTMPAETITLNGRFIPNTYVICFKTYDASEGVSYRYNNLSTALKTYATTNNGLPATHSCVEVTYNTMYGDFFNPDKNNYIVAEKEGYSFQHWTYYDTEEHASMRFELEEDSIWVRTSNILLRPYFVPEGTHGLEYQLNAEGTAYTVTNLDTSMAQNYNVVVPAQYNKKPVTAIGENAFLGKSEMLTVSLPDSILSIGANAFKGCVNLRSIQMPDTVTTLGVQSFSGCSSLLTATLSKSITEIPDGAFRDCASLQTVNLQTAKITRIGTEAFSGCGALTAFSFPETVAKIGQYAFENCASLVKMEGLALTAVDAINTGTFEGCAALTRISLPTNTAIIGDYAFSNCEKLYEFEWQGQVSAIGKGAFQNCKALTIIRIPQSVRVLGEYAFLGCTGLSDIQVNNANDIPNGWVEGWNLKKYDLDPALREYHTISSWN